MRSWLYALLRGTIVPHHLGECDRCAAEFHGECLRAQIEYLKYAPYQCRRRACASKGMDKDYIKTRENVCRVCATERLQKQG